MKLPTLYKNSKRGATQQWTIEVVNNQYRTIAGQVGGKLTVTEWTTCKGLNVGKSNATTDNEQALKDAQSNWQYKIDRANYATSIEGITQVKFKEPMLAKNYKDRKDNINFSKGVYLQDKLNGVRCTIDKENGALSRKNKPWITIPHILEVLAPLFKRFPELKLDGEIYNYDLRQDLGELIHTIKRKRPTAEELAKSKKIAQFWVYDIVDESKIFSERSEKLKWLINSLYVECPEAEKYIKIVKTIKVQSHKQIDDLLVAAESDGIEGVMVRLDEVYESGRSSALLKYKSFVEDEFEIIDVHEGEGNLTGKVGKFELKDKDGRTFKSSPIGSHDYWEQMWNDRKQLIGKTATVKYKELTPIKDGKGGVPNIGKVIAIRDYE